jgi:hypothetical protein
VVDAVCETLVELCESMRRYAAAFDASALSGTDADAVVAGAGAIERMAAAVKGLAAAHSAAEGTWTVGGNRSAAHHLARMTGASVGRAGEVLDTARRLSTLPAAAAAFRSGHLSPEQAAAVARAANADPRAESRLVELARSSSLAELREECGRVRAAADPDPEGRRRGIHDGRFLRGHTDAEGAWHLHMRDNPEIGAEIMAALAPIRDRLFKAARAEGRQEPAEAYAADALAELARSGAAKEGGTGRSRGKVIARVDLLALLRGRPLDGEVCELAGFGPVAPSAIRDLIETGDPFLAAVVTKGEQLVGVAHLGRRASAGQQTALEWLYPTCAVRGCGATAFLENDHRVDWATSHRTVLDLLDRLCGHHHDLKTIDNWALVPGAGKRAFVPPEDPRHPRHAPSAAA